MPNNSYRSEKGTRTRIRYRGNKKAKFLPTFFGTGKLINSVKTQVLILPILMFSQPQYP